MPISEQLLNRLREILEPVSRVTEKKMFSGISFMVNGKMCVNIVPKGLMIRIDPLLFEELVEKSGCTAVVMRNREIKGFVYVDEDVLRTKKQLSYWVNLALDFNPKAKASKRKP